MKRIDFLMKQNRDLENGSGMIREWLGIASTSSCKFLALSLLSLILCANYAWADSWTKVTSEPASWAGEYLLIRETSSTAGKAWTGVDAASCQVDATISSGTISSTPTGAVTLTIAAVSGGYSIKVNGGTNNGKYIYGTSGSNVLNFNASAQVNTISYDGTNKCADIVSNTSHIRYNTNRFRYYKSSTYTSSSVVQLYKKDADCSNKVALTKGTPSNGSFLLTHPSQLHLYSLFQYVKDHSRVIFKCLTKALFLIIYHIRVRVEIFVVITYFIFCYLFQIFN